jgi:hypothetical protein
MLVQLGRDADAKTADQGISPAGIWGTSRNLNRPHWNAALRLYRQDKVAEAYELASSNGAGAQGEFADALQILDAEARTSSESLITRINDWLEVEQIPGQSDISYEEIGEIAERAIRKIWAKIGLKVGANILITLLSNDVVLPSHLDTTGFVTLKRPHAKYCLPRPESLTSDTLELHIQVLAACHAAAIISGSMAPPWLICAAEALTDLQMPNEVRYLFCSGGQKWHEPRHLNLSLKGEEFGQNPVQSAIDALNQAVIIGHHLIEVGGIKTFRDCLSYHAPTSAYHYFVVLLSGDPTRDACKKLYGFAPEYLFEQALASCCK